MRRSERDMPSAEFPTRYTLDEARFPGGQERICNEEDTSYEPTADFT